MTAKNKIEIIYKCTGKDGKNCDFSNLEMGVCLYLFNDQCNNFLAKEDAIYKETQKKDSDYTTMKNPFF